MSSLDFLRDDIDKFGPSHSDGTGSAPRPPRHDSLLGHGRSLDFFGFTPPQILSLRLKALSKHPHDAHEKHNPWQKHHWSASTFTATLININPIIPIPAAVSQSSHSKGALRRSVSNGPNTNNRIPISRMDSAHNTYCRFSVTCASLYRYSSFV